MATLFNGDVPGTQSMARFVCDTCNHEWVANSVLPCELCTLRSGLAEAVKVLKKIAEPLGWIREDAKVKGLDVDYVNAMKLINEPIFYRDTAREALVRIGKTR